MKSPRFILLSIAAIALLAGCGKSSSPVNAVPPESPTLDTTPPPVPTGFCVTSDPSTGAESIVWNASSAPDLAKYEVYVSDAKLDLIYDQLPERFWRRCLREGVARASLNAGNLRGPGGEPNA